MFLDNAFLLFELNNQFWFSSLIYLNSIDLNIFLRYYRGNQIGYSFIPVARVLLWTLSRTDDIIEHNFKLDWYTP